MPASLIIRPEAPGDEAAIRRVNELAFDGGGEAGLVDALRGTAAWVPGLSLVAEDGGEVAGHVLFSVVALDTGPELLSLGPMAMLPERQREGIGTRLVQRGVELARDTSHPLVVVLGHPAFYPRFGFEPARPLGIETPYPGIPDEAWMALTLPAHTDGLSGTVRYPPSWDAV
jgi:putative acetyltransferase